LYSTFGVVTITVLRRRVPEHRCLQGRQALLVDVLDDLHQDGRVEPRSRSSW